MPEVTLSRETRINDALLKALNVTTGDLQYVIERIRRGLADKKVEPRLALVVVGFVLHSLQMEARSTVKKTRLCGHLVITRNLLQEICKEEDRRNKLI